MSEARHAVIAGYGPGVGEALGRRLLANGIAVVGLSRSASPSKGHPGPAVNAGGTVTTLPCDVTNADAVAETVARIERDLGPVSIYVHNAAQLLLKPFLETRAAEFEALWRTICLGAVHGAHAVLPAMIARGSGTLLFVGATASVKGGPQSAAFSAAKFALRGLAQSLARAYGPQGVHVAHLVVDGVIWGPRARDRFGMEAAQCLSPEAVAQTCFSLIEQDPTAWSHEMDLRPSIERF